MAETKKPRPARTPPAAKAAGKTAATPGTESKAAAEFQQF